MKKSNSSYSKYKLDNTLNIKFRNTRIGGLEVFGANLRDSITQNTILKQIDSQVIEAPLGTTWVVNYIYKVERTSSIDTNLTPNSYKGPTLFKLFKL